MTSWGAAETYAQCLSFADPKGLAKNLSRIDFVIC